MSRDVPEGAVDDGRGDGPDRPPRLAMLDALSFRRNAFAGLAVGLLFAVGVYLVRVLELLGPVAETREYPLLGPEGYFVLLAFVLAAAVAILVTTGLTVVSLVLLVRRET